MPPLLFCRITWMTHYQGITEADKPRSFHRHVQETGEAYEQFTFQPVNGTYYAYLPHYTRGLEAAALHLERLGAAPDAEYLDGVMVLLCAKNPNTNGVYIVGWFRNARVWRHNQQIKGRLPKRREGHKYYRIESQEAHLLPELERTVEVPFGRSALYYGGTGKEQAALLRRVEALLAGLPDPEVNSRLKANAKSDQRARWQQDQEMRLAVEKTAVELVWDYYTRLGYAQHSREAERNVGYDLLATKGKEELYLEVKGLSGSEPVVQLTASEYGCMRKHKAKFRLCVVTNAVDAQEARLMQVAWNPKAKGFVADTGAWAEVQTQTAAVVRLVAGKEGML